MITSQVTLLLLRPQLHLPKQIGRFPLVVRLGPDLLSIDILPHGTLKGGEVWYPTLYTNYLMVSLYMHTLQLHYSLHYCLLLFIQLLFIIIVINYELWCITYMWLRLIKFQFCNAHTTWFLVFEKKVICKEILQ